VLGAVASTYARPTEIVMRAKLFYFDFHVSDAYVFGQSPAAPKIGDKYAAFRAYVVDGLPQ